MANILMAFFSNMADSAGRQIVPAFYESFMDGLSSYGNKVMAFRHAHFKQDFGEISNPRLIETIKEFNPDIAIIFNNSFFDLTKCLSCPIVIYDVDSPRYFSNNQFIKNNPSRYKFITTQASSVTKLQTEYGVSDKDILLAPFFTSVKNENLQKKNNICFIGTRFPVRGKNGLTPWNSFMATGPDDRQKREFKEVLKRVTLLPSEDKKIIVSSRLTSTAKRFLLDDSDIVMNLSGAKRELVLSEISDLGLVIHGQKEWIFDSVTDVDLALSYDPQPVVSLRQNQDTYNSSRIGININHVQADSGFSWRVLDIMASGACLVTERNARLTELFPNLDILSFTNRFMARDICKNILNDEKGRLEIVAKCNSAIDKNFRFKHLLPQIENFIEMKLKNNEERASPQILHIS